MMKLSQLVSSALEDAQTKIASAQDAEKLASGSPGELFRTSKAVASEKIKGKGREIAHAAGGFAAGAAAGAGTMHGIHKSRKEESEEKTSALSTATEAMKFAESLEHLAMLFPKLASASVQINDVSGPAVLVSPSKGTTKDTSTKATSLSKTEASTQSGGDGMHIDALKSPYAKQAAVAILEAKIAQSNALLLAGQAQAATSLAKQAQLEFEAVKKAYDEDASTPKGNPESLAVNRKPGDFPVPGSKVTDNAGMIDMTKRQAKTDDVRASARQHLSEPALSSASDKGLTDNLEHTEGAKIANIFQKAAARKQSAEDEPGMAAKVKGNASRLLDRAAMAPGQRLRSDLKSATGV